MVVGLAFQLLKICFLFRVIEAHINSSKLITKHIKNRTGVVHWYFDYVHIFSNCVHGVVLLIALGVQLIYF
jgi:hypothetical protein